MVVYIHDGGRHHDARSESITHLVESQLLGTKVPGILGSSNLSKNNSTKRGTLSPRQEEILQQVEGRWSDEALSSRATWADRIGTKTLKQSFGLLSSITERRDTTVTLFTSILRLRVFAVPGSSFREGIQQAGTQQVCGRCHSECSEREPKFPVGGTAVFRTGARTNKGKPCIILKHGDVTEHVNSHAKGSKANSGFAHRLCRATVWTEERWLKKAKKKK